MVPAWIIKDEDKPTLDKPKTEIIRRIFRDILTKGTDLIAKELNDEAVRCFAPESDNVTKRYGIGGRYRSSFVADRFLVIKRSLRRLTAYAKSTAS